MKCHQLLVLSVCALLGRGDATSDHQRIQGSWKCVLEEDQQGKLDFKGGIPNIELMFKSDRYYEKEAGEITEGGRFKLNESMTPKWIDMYPDAFPGRCAHGIYELDGTTLRVVLGETRPSNLKKAEQESTLFGLCP